MNKFLTINDDKINQLDDFVIPIDWWSRPYEYAFCDKFLDESKVIMDAGCGIEHPWKWYAAKRSKYCYAIDKDERLMGLNGPENLQFINTDLTELLQLENKIDTIFCISVLEHIEQPSIPNILDHFGKYLKNGGQIILTCDYPTIDFNVLAVIAESLGYKIKEQSYNADDKTNICYMYYPLKVFTLVLEIEKNEKLIDIEELSSIEFGPTISSENISISSIEEKKDKKSKKKVK